MPIYDCGDPECEECQMAFKDRTKAIENYRRREEYYAKLELQSYHLAALKEQTR